METKNTTHKIIANDNQLKEIIDYYDNYIIYNSSPYIIARIKLPQTTITIYKTKTILFQGDGEAQEYNYWANKFNLPKDEVVNEDDLFYQTSSIIGSDEVGTGDYFGPIVVCAAYVNKNNIEKLKKIGVKDSKLMTDAQMLPLGLKIAEIIPYSVMILEPERYNKLSVEQSNLNFIKAYLHNKVILKLKNKLENEQYDQILVDQFTPKDKFYEYLSNQTEVEKNITFKTKAEKISIAVAAASVLARVVFINYMNKLSSQYDITFIKGAGPEVDRNAIFFVKSYGFKELSKVAKIKYNNTLRIKEYFVNNPLPKSKQES